MRLRLCDDPEELLTFLKKHEYPYQYWTVQTLASHCLMTAIDSPCGAVAGFVWFDPWTDICNGSVYDLHICFDPAFRGRAVTPRVLRALFSIARLRGAKTILARPEVPHHAHYLVRLGFKPFGPLFIYSFTESPNGQAKETEDRHS